MARILLLCAAVVATGCEPSAAKTESAELRVVTLGGALTEIVFALDAGDVVVGVDKSSVYPPAVNEVSRLGSHNGVSAESVLALRPTHVLASSRFQATVLDQLRGAGVEVSVYEEVKAPADVGDRIRRVAVALGRAQAGDALARKVDAEIAETRTTAAVSSGPRVLFIYARGSNVLHVAGAKTPADEMIRLAGGVNATTGFDGFKPLSSEAAVAAAPDVILMMKSGAASLQDSGGVFALPGIAMTPAGKNKRLIAMDGLLLLGFGPRTATAVTELRAALRAAVGPDPT